MHVYGMAMGSLSIAMFAIFAWLLVTNLQINRNVKRIAEALAGRNEKKEI